MTFYGGTPDELHGWTNVLRNTVDACSNKTITEDWKMKILVQLSGKIFDRTKRSLYTEWQNATDEFIAELKPHVASGKALGVFMGDEICCSLRLSHGQFSPLLVEGIYLNHRAAAVETLVHSCQSQAAIHQRLPLERMHLGHGVGHQCGECRC